MQFAFIEECKFRSAIPDEAKAQIVRRVDRRPLHNASKNLGSSWREILKRCEENVDLNLTS